MIITPQSDIYLLKVPFELDNDNLLNFANANARDTYFSGLPKIMLDNATYQRKDGVLRYPGSFDDLIGYNYCMYRNEGISNRWFYAYIEDMQFENPSMTSIKLKTDVFMTWQFDIIYKKMFVEREHVNNDTIGLHTVPEGLETGDYVFQNVEPSEARGINFLYESDPLHTPYIVMGVTTTGFNEAIPRGRNYNGVYSGLTYLIFPTFGDCDSYITFTENQFSETNIVSVFMIPYSLTRNLSISWRTPPAPYDTYNFQYAYFPYTNMPSELTSSRITKPSVIDRNYTPKNKKLLTYPYVYLLCSNNVGSNNIYHYEEFRNLNGSYINYCPFTVYGTLGVGCSIKLIPLNYKHGNSILDSNTESFIESLDAGKLPTCGWINDSYINWLTQNSVNIKLEALKDTGMIIGGLGAGILSGGTLALAGLGVAGMGAMNIAESVKSIYEHSLVPPTAMGGENQGDFNFGQKLTFSVYKCSIKEEYGKIIDDYFTAYGYKVNSYKIPNITGRRNWNYVKTSACNIVGDIPQKDLQELKEIFNRGATIWHNPSTFLDYSQDNSII